MGNTSIKIRPATLTDYDNIWSIFKEVIKSGDTYVYDPNTQKEGMESHWFAPKIHTFVAEQKGQIVGSYYIKPNQTGLGSHIANASYMVHHECRGRGIGQLLCEHSKETAKQLGFIAMQFNMVVSTNKAAVHLWQKCGFRIIGTIPKGYLHSTLGYVDAYVMYLEFA